MMINSSDFQNNVGKYLDLADEQEIIITRNGSPVARLLGMNKSVSFLADSLIGLIPADIDESSEKAERLARQ